MIDDVNPGAVEPPAEPRYRVWVGPQTVDLMGVTRDFLERLAGRKGPCSCGAGCAQNLDPDDDGMAGWVLDMVDSGKAIITTGDPDAFTFSIGPPTLDNCPTCRGTGEINEFPADDDERLVACPTCGGTGEVYE